MRQRKCNQWGCDGIMRPTKKMHGETLRIFKCVVCGKENPWVDKPVLNGLAGELHLLSISEASGLSLLSDPMFYPPKNPYLINRPRRKS